MKNSITVLLAFSVLIFAFVAFNMDSMTGNYVKYSSEDLERKLDKTEIYIYNNPAKRGSSMSIRVVPGVRGIEKKIDMFLMRNSEEVYLKTFVFCPQHVCQRGRIYSVFISRAYNPGQYKLRLYDRAFGPIDAVFKVA